MSQMTTRHQALKRKNSSQDQEEEEEEEESNIPVKAPRAKLRKMDPALTAFLQRLETKLDGCTGQLDKKLVQLDKKLDNTNVKLDNTNEKLDNIQINLNSLKDEVTEVKADLVDIRTEVKKSASPTRTLKTKSQSFNPRCSRRWQPKKSGNHNL
jgi:chromosome segregation ATPase